MVTLSSYDDQRAPDSRATETNTLGVRVLLLDTTSFAMAGRFAVNVQRIKHQLDVGCVAIVYLQRVASTF